MYIDRLRANHHIDQITLPTRFRWQSSLPFSRTRGIRFPTGMKAIEAHIVKSSGGRRISQFHTQSQEVAASAKISHHPSRNSCPCAFSKQSQGPELKKTANRRGSAGEPLPGEATRGGIEFANPQHMMPPGNGLIYHKILLCPLLVRCCLLGMTRHSTCEQKAKLSRHKICLRRFRVACFVFFPQERYSEAPKTITSHDVQLALRASILHSVSLFLPQAVSCHDSSCQCSSAMHGGHMCARDGPTQMDR